MKYNKHSEKNTNHRCTAFMYFHEMSIIVKISSILTKKQNIPAIQRLFTFILLQSLTSFPFLTSDTTNFFCLFLNITQIKLYIWNHTCLLWDLALFCQHYGYKISIFDVYILYIKILYITLVPILLMFNFIYF